jgi:predicted GIY-YIG superfamily endonuclease
MSTAFGYVLLSSGDRDSYFYYGVTVDPVRRLQAHLSGAKGSDCNLWKARTIQCELELGNSVELQVLFQYPSESEAYAEEDYWIQFLRASGHREHKRRTREGMSSFLSDTERKTESYKARGRKVSEKKTKEWAELTPEQREFRGVRMALGKRFAKAARNGWVLSLIQPCDPGVNHR